MAAVRRFAALSDYDTAPDVYQTPELSDDVSTLPTNEETSHSEASTHSGDDNDPSGSAVISRRPLHATEARNRFESSNVDASTTDFSDRIHRRRRRQQQRQGYQASESHGPAGERRGGPEESRELRIARLTQELQEVREEMELEAEGVQEGRGEGGLDEVAERLRGLLDEIQARQRVRTGRSGADHDLKSEGESEGKTAPARAEAPGQHEDVTRNKHAHSSRPDPSTLGTIAAFDTRLATLEATLGCSSASPADALQAPVQPTLDRLAAQIRLLSETTPARLDQLNKQIQALTESSEKLVRLRSVARSAADELQTARERELRLASMTRSSSPVKRSVRPGGGAGSLQISGLGNRAESELPSEPSILADPEALQKVRVLHELLPTINDIAPVLPGLVRRLQSLRLIHDGAGSVKDELDELEGRQAGLKGEIAEWTSGLARLEASLKDAAGAAELNAGHMQESIARLEERMKTLS